MVYFFQPIGIVSGTFFVIHPFELQGEHLDLLVHCEDHVAHLVNELLRIRLAVRAVGGLTAQW